MLIYPGDGNDTGPIIDGEMLLFCSKTTSCRFLYRELSQNKLMVPFIYIINEQSSHKFPKVLVQAPKLTVSVFVLEEQGEGQKLESIPGRCTCDEIIPNGQGNRMTPSCDALTYTDHLIGDADKNLCLFNPINTIFGGSKDVFQWCALSKEDS
ncbi:PREDICTED: uncharacterized protein LOC105127675 [Populus euphratica]|uniref:Uncharacterized protein LOC105127675 n=1 Tax=Populus euphratica TaxID=75702 RepID=A0AAJ6XQB1_POPEU|nr:PREDICTED: uncharacterized protein LOC105127675 [Populus euphratica]